MSFPLNVTVEGAEGAPALVFSNSLMTDLSLWDAQAAAFAASHRVVRYDQRGHGGSAVPDEDCSFDVLIDDLAGIMARLGLRDATVCGVSMGGVTALGLAARHPDLVGRVAICDCQPASTAAGAAAWDERIAMARQQGMAALAEATAKRWLRPSTLEEGGAPVQAVRRMVAATPLEGFVRAARALQSYDLRPDLARLASRGIPAAFVVGAEDAALPQAVRAMADAVPGAAFTLVPDCGHLPNLERPAAFEAALAALLNRS
jgi:3-oxoadipate enol-lactonase